MVLRRFLFTFTKERKYTMTGTVEGNEVQPTGEQGTPNPAASGGTSQPLPDVQALQTELRELRKLMTGVQKGSDKQIGQIRNDVKRILELKDSGLSEAQINRELQLDALLNGQNPASETVTQGSVQNQGSLDVSLIDNLLDIPANDPRLTDLKLKYSGNPAEYLKQANALKASLKTPSPTPAEQLLPEGKTIPKASLQSEYEGRLEQAKKQSGGRITPSQLSDLKAEYRKKGLDVW